MYYGIPGPDGVEVFPVGPGGYESRWICGRDRYRQLDEEGLIEWKEVVDDTGSGWRPYQRFYLEGRTKQPSNLWVDVEGNKKGTRELRELFDGEKVFDSPKPVGLIKRVIEIACDQDSLVLDFFAGSGTTGEAVVRSNAADGGTRRYILVQLPEPTERPEWPSIASLTRERMRKVHHDCARSPQLLGPLDSGFRAFRLTASNFRVWNAQQPTDVESLGEQLTMSVEHVGDGANDDALLLELLLKAGYALTSPTTIVGFSGVPGYSVAQGALLVCLARNVTIEACEAMVAREPAMIVILDASFGGSDELKVNALQTVRSRNHQSGSDIALRVV